MGLLCPECKEPVRLRLGTERLDSKGNAFKVAPHFAHFPGKDAALMAGCEQRVSQYTPKELAQRAAQTRGQRLKLLQRWFWQTVLYPSNPMSPYEQLVADRIVELAPSHLENWEKNSTCFCTLFRENKSLVKEYVESRLVELANGEHTSWASEDDIKLVQEIEIFKSKADLKMHNLICLEVCDFLPSATSFGLVRSLLALAIHNSTKSKRIRDWFSDTKYQYDGDWAIPIIFYICLSFIVCVPWAERFECLQKLGKPSTSNQMAVLS